MNRRAASTLRTLVFSAAVALGLAACGSDTGQAETPGMSADRPPEGPRRVAFTHAMLIENQLQPDDVAQLQFYVHGRIVLRREATAEGRMITKEHTLKVIDGKAYEELLVEDGTPGVFITAEGAEKFKINFDPDESDAGIDFEVAPDARYRFKPESPSPTDHTKVTTYAGDPYKVIQGAAAYLEIKAEDLRAVMKKQRKLPGTLLPIDSSAPSAAPPGSVAPPLTSSLPPPQLPPP